MGRVPAKAQVPPTVVVAVGGKPRWLLFVSLLSAFLFWLLLLLAILVASGR